MSTIPLTTQLIRWENDFVSWLVTYPRTFRKGRIFSRSVQIVLEGWSESTNKQNQLYFKKWINFCQERGLNSSSTCLKTIFDFLTLLFKEGLFYSSINSTKSALFTFGTIKKVDSPCTCPEINRSMKGIFNLQPPQPRYTTNWNINIVLSFIKSWVPHSTITLKELTLKTVTLEALISGLLCG